MLPAPPEIRVCENCSGLIEQFSLMSGNTFGATYWTDGKMDAPMLPDLPEFVKCPHCKSLLWINEQEELPDVGDKRLGFFSIKRAIPYLYPSFDDLLKGADENSLDKGREIYLRVRTWWKGNDRRRQDNESDQPLSDKEVENLKTLLEMLDENNEHDRILKAEILRELGQFEAAMEMLNVIFDEEVAQAVAQINELSEKGDYVVREFVFK